MQPSSSSTIGLVNLSGDGDSNMEATPKTRQRQAAAGTVTAGQ